MEWWQALLLALLVITVVFAVAAFVLWRKASNRTKQISRRLGKLPWRSRIKLAWRLASDPELPLRARAIPPLLVLYLAVPLDLIPDFIPVLGLLDDVAVLLVALGLLLRFVPIHVIEAHIAALEKEAAAER